MRYVVTALLILGAHFAFLPFKPADAGKAWPIWPLDVNAKPWLSVVGGLPKDGGTFTVVLATVAGIGFSVAALGLYWDRIPAQAWPGIVVVSAVLSLVIYGLYFGVNALLPLALDLVVLGGVLLRGWSASDLRG